MSHHYVQASFHLQTQPFKAALLCASIFAFCCVASTLPSAGATTVDTVTSVIVNPRNGTDSSSCGRAALPCKTIAFAVHNASASRVILSPDIFIESTVNINNIASLVIIGVPSATFFSCRSRLNDTGAAFLIVNSSVTIAGISFENCFNPNSNGGAVTAYDSNVVVSFCSFVNCSAASGGAIAAMAPMGLSRGLFLHIYNSSFFGNSANGGLSGCPSDTGQHNRPCSTWGGAVATFDVSNVTISGCKMEANKARATVSTTSLQENASRNAVSGGGCVSVLFHGNTSHPVLFVSGNTFQQCVVDLLPTANVIVGNGYGGAISIYFGLSAGLRRLDVSFFNMVLQDNMFTGCEVNLSPILGGNAYGGGVSVYVGGYSSVYMNQGGSAVAEVGETVLRNASVTMKNSRFISCTSRKRELANAYGGSVYGGSFSFHVGAYAWSYSKNQDASSPSSSVCGATSASGVSVKISDAPCYNCSALTTSGSASFQANAYGGSMSVVHVGANAWSFSQADSSPSSSVCGATSASEVSVNVSNAPCYNCSALASSGSASFQSNAYGGSMSVVHVGATAWSFSYDPSSPSSSVCGATSASGVSVNVSNAPCYNCSALTTSGDKSDDSFQADAYGGSMSVVHVSATAWSFSNDDGISLNSPSSSVCGATSASGVSVKINNSPCTNCSALIISASSSYTANAHGGSMSVLYVGANAWSFGKADSSPISSTCEATSASGVSVKISDAPCYNCSALTSSGFASFQANAYGGSMSVVYVGANAWSSSKADSSPSSSVCGATSASEVSVNVSNAPCSDCSALTTSGDYSCQANAYGGSMSVVYVGANAWSYSQDASSPSSSVCGATSASGVSVKISDAPCYNCSALTSIGGASYQANAYGGSMSVVHVGANAWTDSETTSSPSSSVCGATSASEVSVNVSNVPCSNCSALASSGSDSFQANAYGGSMRVVHVGATAWSFSFEASSPSSSVCGAASASGVNTYISDAACSNCSALTSSGKNSYQASAYGGSMSVVYVGANAWSYSEHPSSPSSSTCGATFASRISVNVSDAACSNCSALTTRSRNSYEANAYGGSMSVVHVGAYVWSIVVVGSFDMISRSFCDTIWVIDLYIFVGDSTMLLTKAVSSKCCRFCVFLHA
jgi:hypothetical protein